MKISWSAVPWLCVTKTINWRKRKGNFNLFFVTHFQGYLSQDGGALPQAVDVLLLQIQITGIVNIYNYTSLGGQGLAGQSLLVDRGWLAGLSRWTGAGWPLSLDRGWLASHWTGAGLSCWQGLGLSWAGPPLLFFYHIIPVIMKTLSLHSWFYTLQLTVEPLQYEHPLDQKIVDQNYRRCNSFQDECIKLCWYGLPWQPDMRSLISRQFASYDYLRQNAANSCVPPTEFYYHKVHIVELKTVVLIKCPSINLFE